MKSNGKMTGNGSDIWPYIIVGSAIGGVAAYLIVTDSGRKIRHAVAHPDDLAGNLEEARDFIQRKAQFVSEQVHGAIAKAKLGIDEGERAYHEAERRFQLRAQQIEGKNEQIAASVHQTVDNVSRTAVTVERSVLDPICELGALYRGIERGVRAIWGKSGPTPAYRDIRR
jgi:hypothetical protein